MNTNRRPDTEASLFALLLDKTSPGGEINFDFLKMGQNKKTFN